MTWTLLMDNFQTQTCSSLLKLKSIQHKNCKLPTRLLVADSIIPIQMPFHEWRNVTVDCIPKDFINVNASNFTFNEIIVHDVINYGSSPLEHVNVEVHIPNDDEQKKCVEFYINISVVQIYNASSMNVDITFVKDGEGEIINLHWQLPDVQGQSRCYHFYGCQCDNDYHLDVCHKSTIVHYA